MIDPQFPPARMTRPALRIGLAFGTTKGFALRP
jgi:hypothetical protein